MLHFADAPFSMTKRGMRSAQQDKTDRVLPLTVFCHYIAVSGGKLR